jgi:hypothetical protein
MLLYLLVLSCLFTMNNARALTVAAAAVFSMLVLVTAPLAGFLPDVMNRSFELLTTMTTTGPPTGG